MTQKLLTVAEAAHRLGLSEADLTRMAKAGEINGLWIGGEILRFHPDDLEEFLRQAPKKEDFGPTGVPQPSRTVSGWDRVWDFIYTYDFYLIAGLAVAAILGPIFLLHR